MRLTGPVLSCRGCRDEEEQSKVCQFFLIFLGRIGTCIFGWPFLLSVNLELATKVVPAQITQPPQHFADLVFIQRMAQGWLSGNHDVEWLGYLAAVIIIGYSVFEFPLTNLAMSLSATFKDHVSPHPKLSSFGIAGIALAAASGWTTWDGMANATQAPLLSLFATIGIVGVLLIASWRVGASLTVGQASNTSMQPLSRPDLLLVSIPVLVLAGAICSAIIASTHPAFVKAVEDLLLRHQGPMDVLKVRPLERAWIWLCLGVGTLLLIATHPAASTLCVRTIKQAFKSPTLSLMFLLAMTMSVFFSFDALCSALLPQGERQQVTRTSIANEIGGILDDLGIATAKYRTDAIAAFFASSQWVDYRARLDAVVAIAKGAPDQLADLGRRELEAVRSEHTNRDDGKTEAVNELTRVSQSLDARFADIDKLKVQAALLEREVDRLNAEILSNDGGFGGNSDDIARTSRLLHAEALERATELTDRRDKIAAGEIEVAGLEGTSLKLRSEIERGQEESAANASTGPTNQSATTEAMAITSYAALADSLATFMQYPDRSSFEAIHNHCETLAAEFEKVPGLLATAKTKAADCDTTAVAEPLARIGALNEGLATYNAHCANTAARALPSIEDLRALADSCVRASGLGKLAMLTYQNRIDGLIRFRDDNTRRFAINWSALHEGNGQAYLALAVAFGIDGLIFVAGLLSANPAAMTVPRWAGAVARPVGDIVVTWAGEPPNSLRNGQASKTASDKEGGQCTQALARPIPSAASADIDETSDGLFQQY